MLIVRPDHSAYALGSAMLSLSGDPYIAEPDTCVLRHWVGASYGASAMAPFNLAYEGGSAESVVTSWQAKALISASQSAERPVDVGHGRLEAVAVSNGLGSSP